MKLNETKDNEQKKALNAWADNNGIGSLIAGTGFGKSRCGVAAINYILRSNPSTKALVLVPTIQLQEQFEDEFHKWGYSHCLDSVDIMCYQSAYKLQGQHYSIVVCDEIHLGLSKEHRKFFSMNTYDNLLCMTATEPEELEYKHILRKLAPTIYNISLDECVKLGLVSPYEINCIPIKLTDTEREEYKKINKMFVYYKYELGMFDAFDKAKEHLNNTHADPQDKANAANFFGTIRMRKKIIDSAENKLERFKELVTDNTDSRIISFGGINAFTDKMCAAVDPLAVVYHSGKTVKQRKLALDAFKEGSINVLCSTKALNQGLDIPDANMGIICGITSKGLSMIQRVGRLVRFQEGKTGTIYILYVEDSQEETWLKKAVKNLNNVNWLKA